MDMKIAFTTSLPAEGFARLEQHTLYAPLEEADVLVSTFYKPVTREMIMSAPHLQLVQTLVSALIISTLRPVANAVFVSPIPHNP